MKFRKTKKIYIFIKAHLKCRKFLLIEDLLQEAVRISARRELNSISARVSEDETGVIQTAGNKHPRQSPAVRAACSLIGFVWDVS